MAKLEGSYEMAWYTQSVESSGEGEKHNAQFMYVANNETSYVL